MPGELDPANPEKACKQCGSELGPDNFVCPNCGSTDIIVGRPLDRQPDTPGPKYNPWSNKQPLYVQKNTPIASSFNNLKHSKRKDREQPILVNHDDDIKGPDTSGNYSTEFKTCPDPTEFKDSRKKYDEYVRQIQDTCDHLAIDG